ncbi:hypothetical protein KR084_008869 [Drosophila pseudotakahashii]|nr:hypothetical protein KR084_008869 [Drosophila pseudotakahashii]
MTPETMDLTEEAPHLTDMMKELRDYCVRQEMPLPTIEIVEQRGSPEAPEFVACCSVASIVRFGESKKIRLAIQRAAIEMLTAISDDVDELRPSQAKEEGPKMNEAVESERRKKFKTYRELAQTGNLDNASRRLCDRHKYFQSFFPALKEAAFTVIRSDGYASSKDKALSLLDALKITPSISILKSMSEEPLMCIELNCDFDAVFVALESEIYDQMINYLRIMLS